MIYVFGFRDENALTANRKYGTRFPSRGAPDKKTFSRTSTRDKGGFSTI